MADPTRPTGLTSGLERPVAPRRPSAEVLRENESLRRLVAINNRLSRLALQGASLEAITRILASSTRRTIVVLDPLLKTLAAAGEDGDPLEVAWVSQDPQLVAVLGAAAASREALRIPTAPDSLRPGCVIAPILFGDEVFAYLLAVESPTAEASDFDLLITEHAATALAVGMARDRVTGEVSSRVKDDLVDALLRGHSRDARETRIWAQALGCDAARGHRVLCLVPENLVLVTREDRALGPATTALRRRILQSLAQMVAGRAGAAIASARQEELVVILPEARQGERTISAGQLGDAAISHLDQLVPRAQLTVGVGGRCDDVAGLAGSYQQARRAIGIAHRLGKVGQLVVFEELGIYRLLFQVPDSRELRAFADQVLGPLVIYDRKHRAGLVRTLAVYLRQNGSLHAAAQELHIHPNTVNYRLSRIAEIASLYLTDHEDRLAAEVAIKILEVLDEA